MVATTPLRGGGVGCGRLDIDTDVDTDEEVEAREGGNLGEEKELIWMGGNDTVDAAGGHCGGGGAGSRQGARQDVCRLPGGHPRRAKGGPIAVGGRRQGEALRILRFRHVLQ